MAKHHFNVSGLHCAGCVNSVSAVLEAQPGVTATNVDLASGRVEIDASNAFDAKAIIQAVRKAGFVLTPA